MTSLVLHHDDCLRHQAGLRHAESPDRVKAVLTALEGIDGIETLPAPRATLEQLTGVHPAHYWEDLVQTEPTGDGEETAIVALDADTFMSPGTINATLRGSGAACFAVEQIEASNAANAF